MGLFLLGIPIAIMSGAILCKDIKYTSMDLKIPQASHQLHQQYKQIDTNFAHILQYSGAKCNIKQIGYDKYDINNVQKGQYGGMERYLAEKGYYPQAINYAKNCFDEIAKKEEQLLIKERDKRINRYERKLQFEGGEMFLVDFNIRYVNYPKLIVEKEVQRMIEYLKNHYNDEVFCNIIMREESSINHQEVWHIKVPQGEKGFDYLSDIANKLDIKYCK